MLFYVLLDGGAGEIVRVKIVTGRHGRSARERAVLVDEIPAAAHDRQQCFQLRVRGRFEQRQSSLIALPPVDVVEKPACLHELLHHLLFAC
jgi:hypothetical protein